MKLEKSKEFLVLPPVGELKYVHLHAEMARIELISVGPRLLSDVRAKTPDLIGRPLMYSFNWTGELPLIEFFPAADIDYEIEIAFYPPMQVV